MSEYNRRPHGPEQDITVRLDRWASLLSNEWQAIDGPLCRQDFDDLAALATLLVEAANELCRCECFSEEDDDD